MLLLDFLKILNLENFSFKYGQSLYQYQVLDRGACCVSFTNYFYRVTYTFILMKGIISPRRSRSLFYISPFIFVFIPNNTLCSSFTDEDRSVYQPGTEFL